MVCVCYAGTSARLNGVRACCACSYKIKTGDNFCPVLKNIIYSWRNNNWYTNKRIIDIQIKEYILYINIELTISIIILYPITILCLVNISKCIWSNSSKTESKNWKVWSRFAWIKTCSCSCRWRRIYWIWWRAAPRTRRIRWQEVFEQATSWTRIYETNFPI